jgi:hypothetical protein
MAAGRLANLSELGERRLADMDKAGIDIQVLSHTHPSPEILPATRTIPLCRIVNEELGEAVARYPRRFAAFATLPVADPQAAASELEWAVGAGFKGALINGVTQGRFLDDPFLYAVAGTRGSARRADLYSSRAAAGTGTPGLFLGARTGVGAHALDRRMGMAR